MAEDILIIDDEEDIRLLISGILEDEGYETRQAASAEDAVEQIGTRRPSLVILDIWLEGSRLDGMELLHILRHEHPEVPVVRSADTVRSRPPSRPLRSAPMTISKSRSRPIV